MDDFIESSFAELDKFYPGSKRMRRTRAPKSVEATADEGWDAKPVKKNVNINGNEIDFYGIGAVATAVGRPIVTIRNWISKGYLPPSTYRLPSTKAKNGKEQKGYRLYSRNQIEVLVELLAKAGLFDKKRLQWPNQQLTNAIAEAWNNIRAEETKPTETKEKNGS